MGASRKAIERVDEAIRKCIELGRREVIDGYLDIRYDITERATEWDAEKWGFHPSKWMEKERAEMSRGAPTPRSLKWVPR